MRAKTCGTTSTYYPEAWGKILRHMRLELDMLQKNLGNRVGFSRTLISRWENGQACDEEFRLSRQDALKLASVFAGQVAHLKRPSDVVDWLSLIGVRPTKNELVEMKPGNEAWKDGIDLAWVSRYQVPTLPQPHVVRQQLMNRTKRYLIDESDSNVPLVLTGAPGVGKSVLAMALAADREIRAALPHAVLWLQINDLQSDASSDEQLIPVLRKWRQAWGLQDNLTYERLFGWLNHWVKYERVLLVIDNVLRYQTVKPFLMDSKTCRTIITTRNRKMTSYLPGKSQLVDVGQLQLDESRQLIEAIVGATTEPIGASKLEEVTARLGGNTLALEIVAKVIKARGLHSTMAHLNDSDGGRLGVLSRDGEDDPNQCVAKSFSLSYRQLDPESRRCYRALGQLPGASRFTVRIFQAVAKLPQRYKAQVALDHFVDQSLLQIEGAGYRLHPLLFEYARKLLKGKEGLDLEHCWVRRYTGGLVGEWHYWRASVPRPRKTSIRGAGGVGAWIKAGLRELRIFRPAIRAVRRRDYGEAIVASWDRDDIPLDHWIALRYLKKRTRLYLRLFGCLIGIDLIWCITAWIYLNADVSSIYNAWFLTILYLTGFFPILTLIVIPWLGTIHMVDLHRLWNLQ